MTRAIAVLRPEPGNAATAAAIAALGYRAMRLPLFAVRPVAWTLPASDYDSLLLTSANAVRHAGPDLARLIHLPVHAVGRATAAAARGAGLTVVSVGDGGVAAMAPPGRVLRLVGREHHGQVQGDRIVVYASDALDPDLSPLVGHVALVHSARAAHTLAERISDRSDIALAVLSPAVAAAAGSGWRAIVVAQAPTDGDLIRAALPLAD